MEPLAAWTAEHPDLGTHRRVPMRRATRGTRRPVSVEDVTELAEAEPNQVLATADELTRCPSGGRLKPPRSSAGPADREARAGELRAEAGQHRANAAELRAGKLLPLPRPELGRAR